MNKNIYIRKIDANTVKFSGISFADLFSFLEKPVENILITKSEYIGEKCMYGFEVIEGHRNIQSFICNYDWHVGDFCCLDYNTSSPHLCDEDIAELLFISHLFRPLNKFTYQSLDNSFVFLSHDGDYYCKIYSKKIANILRALFLSIAGDFVKTGCLSASNLCEEEIDVMLQKGVYISREEIVANKKQISLVFHIVGDFDNMDDVFNNSFSEEYEKELKISLKEG